MRVSVLTAGSRGDVEPFLALGGRLRAEGHGVRLVTHREFEPVVRAAGLDFAELPGDPKATLAGPQGQALLAARNPVTLVRRLREVVGPELRRSLTAAVDACRDADVIVYSTLVAFGPTVAEHLDVPVAAAHLSPNTPTRAFPMTALPRPVPAVLNHATWRFSEALLWRAFRPLLDDQRADLGLPPLPRRTPPPRRRAPRLYGFSPSLVPPPRDWTPTDHVTGYWFTDTDSTLPPALTDFLDAGEPPVYLGFGSMPDPDPAAAADLLLTAARRVGRRAVLLSGWSGLRHADTDDDVLVVDDVPHRALFPRCAAAVHHGGAGTTAAAVLAGIPSVVVPFFADQFFWGRRVTELGVGTTTPTRTRTTADVLTDALRTTLSRTPSARALATRVATEDGPGTAVTVLEHLANPTPSQ
ncbi:glycosyltransferase family 1 protein [Saccharothrix sp. 6-C]|uniref:glycosyltransferase n=1 Tax=Saccharothrix sp. 6-C TaxID=2781735 RepID=UPI0019179694|nr:glycosyltransferase [Saccharothrix sp. 6-C]QQQ78158.1 glycosyltransferase family 1 protein [Saccharothrix sp. 6-C]